MKYVVVGAGLFGAVVAHELHIAGKNVVVYEKSDKLGGACRTEWEDGIVVHKYGPHIFHTDDAEVWNYVNQFTIFRPFINSPIAVSHGKVYPLPFNMHTFNCLWGVTSPDEAQRKINYQTGGPFRPESTNLEEQAISLVGRDIYNILIRGYTEKQWGKKCKDLPPEIIKRLPVRFTYDNNYYNSYYQGIPEGGYTSLIVSLLQDIPIEYGREITCCTAFDVDDIIIYTGCVDKFYDYCFGKLPYRSLEFQHVRLDTKNYQGVAVVNYTDGEVPYTRIIEHKHFDWRWKSELPYTIITKETPVPYTDNNEPYYPVPIKENLDLYNRYVGYNKRFNNVILAGRLGSYKYVDMDVTVRNALDLSKKLISGGYEK